MLQRYIANHVLPSVASKVASTALIAAADLTAMPFKVGSANALSAIDANYNINAPVTGIANAFTGFYCAQRFAPVPGYSEMHAVCSVGLALAGLSAKGFALPFFIDVDLETTPNFTLSDPALRMIPVENGVLGVTCNWSVAFPVPNDVPTGKVRYFGAFIFDAFNGSAPTRISGAISLRQVNEEFSVFMPNK